MARQPRHQSLVAWQRADDFFIRLHHIARQRFPAEERFELTGQLRRAALLVPANIVEATARHYPGERLQLLRTAWASLSEVGYFIHVAERLGYLSTDLARDLEADLRQTAAPLVGLIREQERRQRQSRAPST